MVDFQGLSGWNLISLPSQLLPLASPFDNFADWCAEVRDLAGERWPEVSDQAPTLYAVWGGGA
jgi:hypothetical protein